MAQVIKFEQAKEAFRKENMKMFEEFGGEEAFQRIMDLPKTWQQDEFREYDMFCEKHGLISCREASLKAYIKERGKRRNVSLL